MPTSIRKVLIPECGDHTHVKIVDDTLADPEPKHVQIKVLYSGFSAADITMRMGVYPMQRKAPLTPGYCAVGIVHANGQGSNKFTIGDRVGILSVYDAEATYVNFPEKFLFPVPTNLDAKLACALILDWSTAYGMVDNVAQVSKGQKVFIHGLSGAVGQALVNLCLLRGAEVYGTASERNHESLRKQGAHPFEYRNKDWIQAMIDLGGASAVFDPLGFESFDESYKIQACVEHGGSMLIGYGGNSALYSGGVSGTNPLFGVTKLILRGSMKMFTGRGAKFYIINRESKQFLPNLNALFGLLKEKKIEPVIKTTLTLDQIPDTHRDWNKIQGMGSMVVQLNEE